ncbi:MAG: orotate phosphoribosyltransferase [Planctomycetes bacterium]|nr:orotate phosphoribosyltransferase [Planctomycetota bacterium]
MYDRQRLIDLFQASGALKFGDFTLASGRRSSYFLDGKLITLQSEGLKLVCEGLLELLHDVEFDAVGGMSMGADPIVAGMLTVAAETSRPLDGWLVRQQAKGRGTNKFVEGPVRQGAKVVVIDDVVTTGGSALKSVERIREAGGDVVLVVGVVDRLEGGAETFEKADLPFRSLLTVSDFGITPAPV